MGQNKSVPHHHCQGCPSPIPSPFSQPYAGPGIAHVAAALAALSRHIEPVGTEACRGGGSLNGRTWAVTGWWLPCPYPYRDYLSRSRRERLFPSLLFVPRSSQLGCLEGCSFRVAGTFDGIWRTGSSIYSFFPSAPHPHLPRTANYLFMKSDYKICAFMQNLAFRFAHLYNSLCIFMLLCDRWTDLGLYS